MTKNRNYKNGRAREYRLKKKYEKSGMIVLRTAGSHGFADLICIDPENKEIHFIQSKSRNFSENSKKKSSEENSWVNNLNYKTWYRVE